MSIVSKNSEETYLQYKSRVVDSKSSSFCGAKWFNATIWLGSGKTTSCHHPPAHKIDIDELKLNPTAIHNTPHKKEMRRMMQKGERPQECDYCWKIEDIDKNLISDRIFKTIIYSDADLSVASSLDFNKDINLQTLEIAFDRKCQFACSYCNANFSTAWSQEIKKNGPYLNLKSDGAAHFTSDGDESDLYASEDKSPFIEAFWRWWPELSQSLKELRITGGEPLLTPQLWKLFDFFGDRGGSGELVFAVNTNLGSRDELVEKLIEKSHYINRFKLFTSGEACGSQAEYIRDGLNYDNWTRNLEKILLHGRVESVNLMATINALSIFTITEFLNHTLQIKKNYLPGYLNWSINILRFPSFQSVSVLPDVLKKSCGDNLKKWCENNFDSPFVSSFEKESLLRLIDYLQKVGSPHSQSSEREILENDFKSFYQQYDVRRNKNFRITFPEPLVEWYDSIKTL